MSKTQLSRDTVGISLDSTGIRQGLHALADKVRGEVMIAGAAAAARVLADEMKQQVPSQSGRLKQAIYRYYDEKRSAPGRQIYLVGVNKRLAPHWHHIEYGHWRYNKIVNGRPMKAKTKPNAKNKTPGVLDPAIYDLPGALARPVWVPAKPYIRPAYDAKINPALQAALARMRDKLEGKD